MTADRHVPPPRRLPEQGLAQPAMGSRYNSDKPKVSMVLEARHAIEGVARVLEFGARKYARSNWRKGLKHAEIADSMLRHLASWLAGEDIDPESGLPHVDHIACNGLFLAEMIRLRPDLDDRGRTDDKGATGPEESET